MKQILLLSLMLLLVAPQIGEARSVTARKAIVVGKTALYGLAGGFVVGLASQVVNKRTKNIFLGGSLGLYAGIGVGLYIVLSSGRTNPNYEGPDTYEEFDGWDSRTQTPSEIEELIAKKDKNLNITIFSTSF